MTEFHVHIGTLVVTGTALRGRDADRLRAETTAAIAQRLTTEAVGWSYDARSIHLGSVRAATDRASGTSPETVARGVASATTRGIQGAIGTAT